MQGDCNEQKNGDNSSYMESVIVAFLFKVFLVEVM